MRGMVGFIIGGHKNHHKFNVQWLSQKMGNHQHVLPPFTWLKNIKHDGVTFVKVFKWNCWRVINHIDNDMPEMVVS